MTLWKGMARNSIRCLGPGTQAVEHNLQAGIVVRQQLVNAPLRVGEQRPMGGQSEGKTQGASFFQGRQIL